MKGVYQDIMKECGTKVSKDVCSKYQPIQWIRAINAGITLIPNARTIPLLMIPLKPVDPFTFGPFICQPYNW